VWCTVSVSWCRVPQLNWQDTEKEAGRTRSCGLIKQPLLPCLLTQHKFSAHRHSSRRASSLAQFCFWSWGSGQCSTVAPIADQKFFLALLLRRRLQIMGQYLHDNFHRRWFKFPVPSHHSALSTRWLKYDRDKLWLVYTQSVPVIFEPPCT
jgi:hypothetical protein